MRSANGTADGTTNGYVFLDILIGLFILGFGFVIIQGITHSAALSYAQACNMLQAVNLADSTMQKINSDLKKDPAGSIAYLNQDGLDQVGKYERAIHIQWDSPDLLQITVEVRWTELNAFRNYRLESLCYVPD